ncbi:MAG: hypothetical protein K2M10_05555, partial [Muribaculaceae bacterium]|nr:hypothetical protein [Muribaculaceae bacterium]
MNKRYNFAILIFQALIIVVFQACAGGDGAGKQPASEKALVNLDKTLDKAHVFHDMKHHTIDSLRKVSGEVRDSLERWETLLELSNQYRLMNADSAVLIAQQAHHVAPSYLTESQRLHAKLILVQALSTSGFFYATLSRLDSILRRDYPQHDMIDVWKTSRIAYSYAASYAQGLDNYTMTLRTHQKEATDSLLKYLPENDTLRRFLYCSDLVEDSNWDHAKLELRKFLDEVPLNDNLHGMAAYQLAQVYKNLGDFDNYVTWLADAANSDVQSNVKEGLALQELARWLHQQGEYDRANRYITAAMNDAISGNVRMRTAAISNIAPLIEETSRKELKDSHNSMKIYAVTTTVLLIITGVLAVIFLIHSRRMRANEKTLSSTTRKLETYVGNFIALCSKYSSRLDNMTRLINRKISAGQTEALLKMINSGKINEQDSADFYPLVDKA